MYVFEKLIKLIQDKKKQKPVSADTEETSVCEHVFLPIDSSKEYLACYNCGLVVKSKEMKDVNFFKRWTFHSTNKHN